jgi:HEAT repeat protein
MDYSVTFARHFSRLLWLLLNDSNAIDEQKSALRALLTVSKDGPVTLTTEDWRLIVNGAALPEALTGVQDLTAQMIGHAVREITIDASALPADVLGTARILAAEPIPGDGGRVFVEKLQALGSKTVRVKLKELTPVTRGVVPEPDSASVATLPSPPEGIPAVTANTAARPGDSGVSLAFARAAQPRGSVGAILEQLDTTRSVNVATRLLDELVTLAETANREGKSEVVGDAFYGVVKRESEAADADVRRAYLMALRRMCKPTLLRAVATLLCRNKEKRDEYMAVLTRAGEDGADSLIELLTASDNTIDRRVCFDALVKLQAGVTSLIHMLGDPRWYVARNAADLLGELGTSQAEAPLGEALKHDDDRVRRAAANSLAKLGTPNAMRSLRDALHDTSPQVRLQAAAGLASRKGLKTSGTLIKALDDEQDSEVQFALIAALGKVATPDAIQKLVEAAKPEGLLSRKKAAGFRVAAVHALGDARTASAMTALKNLTSDKDSDVRDAASRVLQRAQQLEI